MFPGSKVLVVQSPTDGTSHTQQKEPTPMTKAHFGVTVPQIRRTWEEAKAAATEFEALGYDSIWVNDHLYGPQSPQMAILEAWSMVAALAAITNRVEIGTLVT